MPIIGTVDIFLRSKPTNQITLDQKVCPRLFQHNFSQPFFWYDKERIRVDIVHEHDSAHSSLTADHTSDVR